MKRSHKVRVTKKDVYLTNDNLADDEGNITESKERESKNQKLLVRAQKVTTPVSLNWIGLLLLIKKIYW